MVKVACHVIGGLLIGLTKPGYDDGTGDNVKTVAHDGPAIRLNGPDGRAGGVNPGDPPPGITEVDGDWYYRWEKQNEQNPIVTLRQVYALPELSEPNPT